ncbi:MAG: DUF5320 domain-containing protein [Desulfobacterales bacterium]|jgi:hypothetical protein
MPREDRTGPQAQGPITGRGRGRCNSKDGSRIPQGQDGMGSGRGQGRRSGRGDGRAQSKGKGAGHGRGKRF